MRPVRFLVPGTTGKFRCGGLSVELQTARLVGQLVPVELVTYRQRQSNYPFLKDLLRADPPPGEALWIVSWGFDVPRLLRQLRGRPVAYHAHSSGYGFDLPPATPVLAVSRNTLGYWGDRSPRSPLALVPNALEHQWIARGARPGNSAFSADHGRRPIDILVQRRKSSTYLLEQLVPALQEQGFCVHVQSGWVDDLVDLFNSSTVFLYDSADYWRGRGVTEGFGLPPIEAMACGCVVFSSLNHALADNVDPGLVGHQIGCGTLAGDLERITAAVHNPGTWRPDASSLQAMLERCSEEALSQRWKQALLDINNHWDYLLKDNHRPLISPKPGLLRWQQWWFRLEGRLRRWLSLP